MAGGSSGTPPIEDLKPLRRLPPRAIVPLERRRAPITDIDTGSRQEGLIWTI